MRALVGVVVEKPREAGTSEEVGGEASPDTLDAPARAKPWSHFPSWQAPFLESLARIPNVTLACEAAWINRQTAYNARKADEVFAAAWDDALATSRDHLEAVIWEKVMKGESDRLAEMLLRAHKPEQYGERRAIELSGPAGGPIQSTNELADTDEERTALKAAIRRELARRGEPVEG